MRNVVAIFLNHLHLVKDVYMAQSWHWIPIGLFPFMPLMHPERSYHISNITSDPSV